MAARATEGAPPGTTPVHPASMRRPQTPSRPHAPERNATRSGYASARNVNIALGSIRAYGAPAPHSSQSG